MSALAPELTPVSTSDGDDDLDHLYCCDENRALCGTDISEATEIEDGPAEDECVVCVALADALCPICDTYPA